MMTGAKVGIGKGDRYLYSGCVVKTEHMGFAGGPNTGYERKEGIKNESKSSGQGTGTMDFYWLR